MTMCCKAVCGIGLLLVVSVFGFRNAARADDEIHDKNPSNDAVAAPDVLDRELEIPARVTEVDRSTGRTTLQPDEGGEALVFQFTPQAVANLQTGDMITARLTYSTSPPPKVGSPAGDAPLTAEPGMRLKGLEAALGQKSVTGMVKNVDSATGRFDVETSNGLLQLKLRPSAVKNLQPGQTISVDMGFSKKTAPGSTTG